MLRLLAASALIAAVGAVAFEVGNAGAERAPVAGGTAYVLSDVECDPADNGVLDLTFVNDSPTEAARFVLDAHTPATSAAVLVAPLSAHAVTYTDLPDGDILVPVQVDGVAEVVSAAVNCDPPRVASLAGTVQQGRAQVGPGDLPRAGSSVEGLVIGGVLVTAGIAASLVAKRRYG